MEHPLDHPLIPKLRRRISLKPRVPIIEETPRLRAGASQVLAALGDRESLPGGGMVMVTVHEGCAWRRYWQCVCGRRVWWAYLVRGRWCCRICGGLRWGVNVRRERKGHVRAQRRAARAAAEIEREAQRVMDANRRATTSAHGSGAAATPPTGRTQGGPIPENRGGQNRKSARRGDNPLN